MSRTADREEFSAIMVKEFPDRRVSEVLAFARALMRRGATCCRYATLMCNRELTPAEDRRDDKNDEAILEMCKTWGIEVQLSGDPRGATVKVKLPTGASNSWAGSYWCVPGS